MVLAGIIARLSCPYHNWLAEKSIEWLKEKI